MLHFYNSCVSHEMLTPLKCLIEIAKKVLNKTLERDQRENIKLIINTGELLLNQVKGILDKNLLDQNMFTANLESYSLCQLLHSTVKMIEFHA